MHWIAQDQYLIVGLMSKMLHYDKTVLYKRKIKSFKYSYTFYAHRLCNKKCLKLQITDGGTISFSLFVNSGCTQPTVAKCPIEMIRGHDELMFC